MKLSLTHKETDYIRRIDPRDSILTLPVPKTYEEIWEECRETFMDIDQMIAGTLYFPPRELIFRALEEVPLDEVRVGILGQDPYHAPDVANGLAFSTCADKIPPSLRNIFRELKKEFPRLRIPRHGDLSFWCHQGVLLLNTSLTVEKGKPKSHSKMWFHFIIEVIKRTCIEREAKEGKKMIWLLWGRDAQDMAEYTTESSIKLMSAHPVSRGNSKTPFIGNNHFREVNRLLEQMGDEPINWELPDVPLSCIRKQPVVQQEERGDDMDVEDQEVEHDSFSYESD